MERASRAYSMSIVKRAVCCVAVVLVLAGAFWAVHSLSSNGEGGKGDGAGKFQVVTTFTVLADMARNVAGTHAEVESLTKPGAEIHGYEPTPKDIARLQKADLVLDNGMNLEKWAAKLYQNVPDVPHSTLSGGVEPINISEGPYKDKPNPHAWMSPANALVYVDAIVTALSKYDPAHKDGYYKNAEAYKYQITRVSEKLTAELGTLPESNRYLVSCEGAFSYLIRDYGLRELYLWPINADAQGTPQQVRHVVEAVKAHQVPAVFCESTVNDKAQRQVAAETGAHFGGVFYVDSLSGPEGPTPTYLKLLEYNAATLVKGLQAGSSGEDGGGAASGGGET